MIFDSKCETLGLQVLAPTMLKQQDTASWTENSLFSKLAAAYVSIFLWLLLNSISSISNEDQKLTIQRPVSSIQIPKTEVEHPQLDAAMVQLSQLFLFFKAY